MLSCKILIVDDNSAITDLLSALLEDMFECDCADNGVNALEKIKNGHYDLIISDVEMPLMNRLEQFRRAEAYIANASEHFIFHIDDLTEEYSAFSYSITSATWKNLPQSSRSGVP